jgi:O-antigen ligase
MFAAPAIALWLRTSPRRAPLVWGTLGFLPFVYLPWHLLIAPYATPMWSGYVKGWEISLLDAVAVGIILGTRDRWPRLSLILPLLVYLSVVGLSIAQARFGTLASSYFIQLVRAVLVFVAVARVSESDEGERAVLTGMVVGLTVQCGYAIAAWLGGAIQTGGTVGHQNLLGFISHMVLMPSLAMFMSGRWPRLGLLGIGAGAIVVVLTASRATIALSALGVLMTLFLSLAVNMSGRKIVTAAAGLFILVASIPLASATLQRRLESQKISFFTEDTERQAFERAARSMISDHPWGVGPNHYVFIANTEGYSDRAGVNWSMGNRSANVHNSYLLIAAETGYLGLASFLFLMVSAIWRAFSTGIRFRKQPGSELLLGVGCSLIVMAIHGLFEWVFVLSLTQYLLAVTLGMIAGLRSRFLRGEKGRNASRREGFRASAAKTEVLPSFEHGAMAMEYGLTGAGR